jgi:hypothetical protein
MLTVLLDSIQLLVSGDQTGLTELATLLEAGSGVTHATGTDPRGPSAHGIRILESGDSPVRVSVSDDGWVEFAGSAEGLEAAASHVRIGNRWPGDESHYEYYDGNMWVDPDSLPVVFSRVA